MWTPVFRTSFLFGIAQFAVSQLQLCRMEFNVTSNTASLHVIYLMCPNIVQFIILCVCMSLLVVPTWWFARNICCPRICRHVKQPFYVSDSCVTSSAFMLLLTLIFFCRVLHTMFSHLRAHAFARSVTVARSSAVQASSSRRQERRCAIVCGSPQSQSTDWASSR